MCAYPACAVFSSQLTTLGVLSPQIAVVAHNPERGDGYHAERRNPQISRSDKSSRVSTLGPEGGSDDEVVWECAPQANRSVDRWVVWDFGSSGAKR